MRDKKKNRIKIWKEIRPHLKRNEKSIFGLITLKVFLLLVGLSTPLLFKLLIDNVMIKREFNLLKWICLGYVILFGFESIILTIQKIVSNRVYNKFTFNIRLQLWTNFIKMPFNLFEKYKTGDLKNRIDTDVDVFEKFIGQQVIEYIFFWLVAICNGIILLVINVKLALFGFVMVPLSFWMTKWLGKGAKKTAEQFRETWGKYENWLQECFQGWKEIKALAIEKRQVKMFTIYWHSLSKQFFMRQMYWYGNRTFIGIKDFFITRMNLYFLGGLLIFAGELTIGSLLVFMKYYEQFFKGIGSINNLDMELHTERPSLDKVLDILDKSDDLAIEYKANEKNIDEIEFKGVSFKYTDDQDHILKNFDYKISKGETIALVGRSGSGKTTVIKLLLGLYQPDEGKILFNGKDIRDINPSCLHKNIGVVMQDSEFFNMTIKENLLMVKPSATDDEIKEACKKAYISEFIEGLQEGYLTLIGEKGIKLSGGQKQRLAIARVWLANPDVLIFDEATSSLDHDSEKIVHNAIQDFAKRKTLIIVAHRLSSILLADRVILIDDGVIIGEGTHRELLQDHSIYKALFENQYVGMVV